MLRRQAEALHARLVPDYFGESLDGQPSPAHDRFAVVLVAARADKRGGSGNGVEHVVGYIALKMGEARVPTPRARRRVYVDAVVVDGDHRRRGIGTALMQAASDWARRHDCGELVLTVWAENRAALALYRRLGYEPIARILRREV